MGHGRANKMGAYVNSLKEKKEKFLEREGVELSGDIVWEIADEENLFVCLVDNGHFTAAAIAYSEREFEAFNDSMDTRPKQWYLVPISKLHEVSPELRGYLR